MTMMVKETDAIKNFLFETGSEREGRNLFGTVRSPNESYHDDDENFRLAT